MNCIWRATTTYIRKTNTLSAEFPHNRMKMQWFEWSLQFVWMHDMIRSEFNSNWFICNAWIHSCITDSYRFLLDMRYLQSANTLYSNCKYIKIEYLLFLLMFLYNSLKSHTVYLPHSLKRCFTLTLCDFKWIGI